MKLKLAIVSLIMLGNSACVTSTNSYTRDIVYRDGSYYSPADDQYGDYYYEPEPQYDYYDGYGYNYGFGSGFYGNPWYSHHDAYRCRFSYRFDRYCDNGWGRSSLNFGGISLFFGNSGYYDYGRGYGYGYGYPYYGYYNPYHRHHSSQHWSGKPTRAAIQFPDNSVSNRPSVRVRGEPTRMPLKPAMLDTETGEPILDSRSRQDLNPYTRTREPRQNRRPETWRDREPEAYDQESGIRIENHSPRSRAKPLPTIYNGSDYQAQEKPVRRYQPQPYPVYSDGGQAPSPVQQIRAVPERAVQVERPVRVERTERIERAEPVVRQQRDERSADER